MFCIIRSWFTWLIGYIYLTPFFLLCIFIYRYQCFWKNWISGDSYSALNVRESNCKIIVWNIFLSKKKCCSPYKKVSFAAVEAAHLLNLHFADMEKCNSSNQPVISSAIFFQWCWFQCARLQFERQTRPLTSFILNKKVCLHQKFWPDRSRSRPLAGCFTFDLPKVAEQPGGGGGGGDGVRAPAGRVGLSLGRDKRLRPNAALHLPVR